MTMPTQEIVYNPSAKTYGEHWTDFRDLCTK